VQFSPLARQVDDDSSAHLLPLLESHSLEQQSAFAVQSEPTIRHSTPPQAPLWQASVQQSLARAHGAPSCRQATRQTRVVWSSSGSHRPLQQSAGALHPAPAPAQVPGGPHVQAAQ
jgi:hypothetical protein